MDGVLLDSQPLHYAIDMAVLKRAGYIAKLETVTPYTGMSNPDRWPKYKAALGLDTPAERLIEWANEIMMEMFKREELLPITGIPELLRKLKNSGLGLAVASSSSHALIDLILGKLNIAEFFDVLVSGEDVTVGKPEPDVFLFAAQKLGREPGECVVVEDSPNGIRAAKNAGMVCVAYKNPTTVVVGDEVLRLADYVIEGYGEFPKIEIGY